MDIDVRCREVKVVLGGIADGSGALIMNVTKLKVRLSKLWPLPDLQYNNVKIK